MGARRKGRIIAFQTLYRYGYTEESIENLCEFSWLDNRLDNRLDNKVDNQLDNMLDIRTNNQLNNNETNTTENDSINFAKLLIIGTIENIDEIDTKIKEHLEHWDFSRISKVDLAILRISVYCLLFQEASIPLTVTIDEAIDITKEFGSTDSYRFINGVLDGIKRSMEN